MRCFSLLMLAMGDLGDVGAGWQSWQRVGAREGGGENRGSGNCEERSRQVVKVSLCWCCAGHVLEFGHLCIHMEQRAASHPAGRRRGELDHLRHAGKKVRTINSKVVFIVVYFSRKKEKERRRSERTVPSFSHGLWAMGLGRGVPLCARVAAVGPLRLVQSNVSSSVSGVHHPPFPGHSQRQVRAARLLTGDWLVV